MGDDRGVVCERQARCGAPDAAALKKRGAVPNQKIDPASADLVLILTWREALGFLS